MMTVFIGYPIHLESNTQFEWLNGGHHCRNLETNLILQSMIAMMLVRHNPERALLPPVFHLGWSTQNAV